MAQSTIQALTEDIAALETELTALGEELEKDTASAEKLRRRMKNE